MPRKPMARPMAYPDRPRGGRPHAPRPYWETGPRRGAVRLLLGLALLLALFSVGYLLWKGKGAVVAAPSRPWGSEAVSITLPPFWPVPSPQKPTVTPTPGPLPIGIVAGHWGNDSGAVCDGWLREVDVNLAVAQRVVEALRRKGYPVDLLEEFDPRLEGYRARALVSIHADACLYPEATGFKVARVAESAIPHVEDYLVACLVSRYRARTGLPFHEGSVTPDMTQYHTFYEIDPNTPGAIIEIGFLLADRDLLLHHQDRVAQGVVEGILCFLEGETP